MNLAIRYAALLILMLLTMFIAGNPRYTQTAGSTLSVFPYFLSVFSIPLVITILIVHISKRAGVEFTRQQGIRSGELASRWSAIIFAFAVIMYVLGFYAGQQYTPSVMMILFPGGAAFVLTYLTGLGSAALAAIVVMRIRGGAASI